MKLSDRLEAKRDARETALLAIDAEIVPDQEEDALAVGDAFADIKSRASEQLFDRLGVRLSDASLTEGQLHELVRDELTEIIATDQQLLSAEERRRLLRDIEDDAIGLGPLQRMLDDESMTV